jgi:hypothetical protein
MDNILVLLFMGALRKIAVAYTRLQLWWKTWSSEVITPFQPTRRYFLADSRPVIGLYVPEGAVYVEEWVRGSDKRNVVRYEGEPIPTEWTVTPWHKNPKTPWVWVGDRETEIDLTRTFNKYLVVGNRIAQPLVEKLIRITEKTSLIYIESGTFKELKFPGDGLVIQEYDDGAVQNSGAVHPAQEAVCPPVVG